MSGYPDLVDARVAHGVFFKGPCAIWFRLRHPLVEGEVPSVYQRVAVADSGNGISAILDFARYSFVNLDLTINLLRRPVGEWICLDARTCLGPTGCGLADRCSATCTALSAGPPRVSRFSRETMRIADAVAGPARDSAMLGCWRPRA